MSRPTSFVFDGYAVENDGKTVKFNYHYNFSDQPPLQLSESLTFPLAIDAQNSVVRKLLAALHIGLGVSYYKLFMPDKIELKTILTEQQAAFWNLVYQNGLAEFLYVNQLNPDKLAEFSGKGDSQTSPTLDLAEKAILAVGGGKDSIVAGELLKTAKIPLTGYVLGTGEHPGQAAAVAEDMGLEVLKVSRLLDPQLKTLNERPDTYNGHVPISMVFALAGLLLCVTRGEKYLVVGNEASASIPNTEWQGLIINHQWSKSFGFEQALQKFIHTTILPDLWYFSAIRPLSSVAVAKLFAKRPQYLADFTSCNRVFLIDPAKRPNAHWCGQCAKCLSSFIILAPWLDEAKLKEIFSKNMLDDGQQTELLLELVGLQGHKPLDCVGTEEEMVLSLNLIAKQGKFTDSKLMKLAAERGVIKQSDWDKQLQASLSLSPEHRFPPELDKTLLTAMRESLA